MVGWPVFMIEFSSKLSNVGKPKMKITMGIVKVNLLRTIACESSIL